MSFFTRVKKYNMNHGADGRFTDGGEGTASQSITNPKAVFIPKESWKQFETRALRRKYHAGQHFVLDQQASTIIKQGKIRTFIIGPDVRNISKILKGKRFIGTEISG